MHRDLMGVFFILMFVVMVIIKLCCSTGYTDIDLVI